MKDSDFNSSGMFDGMNFGMIQLAFLPSCAGHRASMPLPVGLTCSNLEQDKFQFSSNVFISCPYGILSKCILLKFPVKFHEDQALNFLTASPISFWRSSFSCFNRFMVSVRCSSGRRSACNPSIAWLFCSSNLQSRSSSGISVFWVFNVVIL